MYNNCCQNNMKANSNYTYNMQDMYAERYGEGYNTCMYKVPVVIPVYIQAQPVPPVYIQAQPVVEMMSGEYPSAISPEYQY